MIRPARPMPRLTLDTRRPPNTLAVKVQEKETSPPQSLQSLHRPTPPVHILSARSPRSSPSPLSLKLHPEKLSSDRPGHKPVSPSLDRLGDPPPLSVCIAAGLQLAVRAWWYGGSPNRSKRGGSEERWLKVISLQATAVERIRHAGVPERVVQAGLQLGHWLTRDGDVLHLWIAAQQDRCSQSEFAASVVKNFAKRFKVRVAKEGGDAAAGGGLIIEARADAPTPLALAGPQRSMINPLLVGNLPRTSPMADRGSLSTPQHTPVLPGQAIGSPGPVFEVSTAQRRSQAVPSAEPRSPRSPRSPTSPTSPHSPSSPGSPKFPGQRRRPSTSDVGSPEKPAAPPSIVSKNPSIGRNTAPIFLSRAPEDLTDPDTAAEREQFEDGGGIFKVKALSTSPTRPRPSMFGDPEEDTSSTNHQKHDHLVDPKVSAALGKLRRFSNPCVDPNTIAAAPPAFLPLIHKATEKEEEAPSDAGEEVARRPSLDTVMKAAMTPHKPRRQRAVSTWGAGELSSLAATVRDRVRPTDKDKEDNSNTNNISNNNNNYNNNYNNNKDSKDRAEGGSTPEAKLAPLPSPSSAQGRPSLAESDDAEEEVQKKTSRSSSVGRPRAKYDSNFSQWLKSHSPSQPGTSPKAQTFTWQGSKDRHVDEMEMVSMMSVNSKKAAKRIIKDIAEVRSIFSEYCEEGSEEFLGSISFSHFLPLIARLMRQPVSVIDSSEMAKIWDLVDSRGSGRVTWDEFSTWYCKTFNVEQLTDFRDFFSDDIIPTKEKVVREVARNLGKDNVRIEKIFQEFNKLDDDGNGSLEFDEFEKLMIQHLSPNKDSPQVSKSVLQKFWIDVDADGSGSVSFPEFAAWYLKFFHGDISPMEHYYQMIGSGARRASMAHALVGSSSKSGSR